MWNRPAIFRKIDEEEWEVTKDCPLFGTGFRTRTMKLKEEEIVAYRSGAHAQRAFPHLSAEDREFIISGIMPEEWKRMFGVPEGERHDDAAAT